MYFREQYNTIQYIINVLYNVSLILSEQLIQVARAGFGGPKKICLLNFTVKEILS